MGNIHIQTVTPKPAKDAFTGPPCPGCGKPTLPGSRYCYHCDRFLDASGTRVLKCGEVPERALEELVFRSNRSQEAYQNDPGTVKSRKALLYGILGMFLGAILVLFGQKFLGMFVMLGSLAAAVVLTQRLTPPSPTDILEGDHFEQMISHYVTPFLLSKTFDRVEVYDPEGHITSQFIDSTGLIYQDYNAIGGSQFLRAVYHGIPMELCNLHLSYVTTDDDNHRQVTEVFSGFWMNCELGTPMQSQILILKKRLGLHPRQPIETDHAEFNRRFLVSCGDQAAAFRFLTPQVMEQILKMDEICGGRLGLHVFPNGRVCVAVDTSLQLFRARDNAEPIPRIRERMENELQVPLQMLELLNSAHLTR